MAWHPFRNLGLKMLALGLSALLWVTITHDQLAERSLRVALEFQNVPPNLEIIGDSPSQVDVRLRGPSSLLGRLDQGDVVSVLDLRSARPGQRLFHLLTDEVRVPFGIDVAEVNPPTVALNFEQSGSKTVPVVPTVEGEPSFGFIAGQIVSDPPAVEIVGPVSHLASLRQATTEAISIEKATSRVVDSVTIGVIDPELRLRQPRNAVVTIEILPAAIERTVPGVPVSVRNLRGDLKADVDPGRVTVALRGTQEALGLLDPSDLEAWIDASSLQEGRYTLPVKLDAGQAFGVARIEPSIVHVTIR